MKQDTWTHSTTRAEYGVTGAIGSPRAWLRRALDTVSLDDNAFQPSSITPTEISVAGVWYKKPTGYGIPATGTHRELFRWFQLPPPEKMMRARSSVPQVPVIGVAAAVPMHQVMAWIKTYRDSGAEYTWWSTPAPATDRTVSDTGAKPARRIMDHSVIYGLLDSGLSTTQIAHQLKMPRENIHYVVKKWSLGLKLNPDPARPPIDVAAMLADYRGGATVSALAVKYQTTPAYVYKVLKIKQLTP